MVYFRSGDDFLVFGNSADWAFTAFGHLIVLSLQVNRMNNSSCFIVNLGDDVALAGKCNGLSRINLNCLRFDRIPATLGQGTEVDGRRLFQDRVIQAGDY